MSLQNIMAARMAEKEAYERQMEFDELRTTIANLKKSNQETCVERMLEREHHRNEVKTLKKHVATVKEQKDKAEKRNMDAHAEREKMKIAYARLKQERDKLREEKGKQAMFEHTIKGLREDKIQLEEGWKNSVDKHRAHVLKLDKQMKELTWTLNWYQKNWLLYHEYARTQMNAQGANLSADSIPMPPKWSPDRVPLAPNNSPTSERSSSSPTTAKTMEIDEYIVHLE